MRLERVAIQGFRNLDQLTLSLGAGVNHVVGPNGAGKTALLEALYVLFRGRSFRTSRMESVIGRGQPEAVIRATLDASGLQRNAGMARGRDAGVELRLDGDDCRISDLAALLPIQLMLPDTSDLVLGGPSVRRSFLDWGTFHVKREHLDDVRGYQRTLRQRNRLLRDARGDVSQLGSDLEVWSAQLLGFALRADRQRREYLEGLRDEVVGILAELAPELDVELSYEQGWPDGRTLEETLVETLPRDVKSGATQSGPHRADIRLATPEGRAADVLSRGQAKILASGMHLAQARKTRQRTGADSLFLIDDVGAELDETHRRTFFKLLDDEQCQVITTGTAQLDAELSFESGLRTFHVEHGACQLVEDA